MTDWSQPQVVDDLTMAFSANVMDTLMPSYEEAEAGLAALPIEGRRLWTEFQADWFFSGLNGDVKFHVKNGVDPKVAFRHLFVIQRSFEPQHEHKVAAVAWLASQWFDDVEDWKR